MHIIAKKALEDFWGKHAGTKNALMAWYRIVDTTDFSNLSALKKTFNTVDYVPPYAVFDVAGNNIRIVANIHYNRQKLYIRHVFTHPEYDRWTTAYMRFKK
jgi:mRNA interferase HigB